MRLAQPATDLDRLLKLRLVVARYGEMDVARWWNTQGMLGRYGAAALGRGLPTTHRFAQARVVFTVAGSRCAEVFNPPDAVTLWRLPAEIEDRFDGQWQAWLDQAEDWASFFHDIEQMTHGDLLGAMANLGLVAPAQSDAVSKLRRSAEGRAVAIAGNRPADDDTLTILAAAFSRGETGNLAVPYAKLGA